MITRTNKFTGVMYRDDPTILAWELMNEPRCPSDLSGKTLQVDLQLKRFIRISWFSVVTELGYRTGYGRWQHTLSR